MRIDHLPAQVVHRRERQRIGIDQYDAGEKAWRNAPQVIDPHAARACQRGGIPRFRPRLPERVVRLADLVLLTHLAADRLPHAYVVPQALWIGYIYQIAHDSHLFVPPMAAQARSH